MTKKEWLAANPLKKWLKRNKWTLIDAARYFGVSYFTVWQYTQGLIPDTRRKKWFFEKLVELTGDETIQKKWYVWEVNKWEE